MILLTHQILMKIEKVSSARRKVEATISSISSIAPAFFYNRNTTITVNIPVFSSERERVLLI
jgi:hypothetical protein